MKKALITVGTVLTGLFMMVVPALAHVVVKPAEVGVAAFQTFTIGVPNEKDNPTVGLRLVMPDGLKYVSPNVKPGWKIEVKKSGEGEDAKVTEIVWTDGSVPEGQRDDFFFSAQVPASETSLKWKAYQTYEDGTVVSWDQEPKEKMSDDEMEMMEKKNLGPYSQTKVVNDLKSGDSMSMQKPASPQQSNLPMILSVAALALSLLSLSMKRR